MVHTGQTGHAEVVQVEYDPKVISYENLLNIFWRCHDPTTINRQGPDEGPQYRSVILYHSEVQRKAAVKSYEKLTEARAFRSPIVTQLVPMQAFFPAEDYHQNYYSGMRRSAPRRRTAASKTKALQRKSTNAGRTAQNSRLNGASGKIGASTAAQKSAEQNSADTQDGQSNASGASSGSNENSPPK
jgi:methionine-S-sulfoxide reductase